MEMLLLTSTYMVEVTMVVLVEQVVEVVIQQTLTYMVVLLKALYMVEEITTPVELQVKHVMLMSI